MPRQPVKPTIPPLEKTCPVLPDLNNGRSKMNTTADALTQVIKEFGSTRNQVFYTTRTIAQYFGISQNTANLAIQELEKQGLVRRVRSSHTLILGNQVVTRANIRAVAGILMWRFAQTYSETHGGLARNLGEELWKHNIALEVITHYDLGEQRPDLDESLKKHIIDFSIWPFPFKHHKEHLLFLEDRGIKNLIIGVKGVPSSYHLQIQVDFLSSYRKLIQYWQNEHGIRRIIVVKPNEFTPRRRIFQFAKLAEEMGLNCSVETNHYDFSKEVLEREKEKVGIALLDEHSTAEFSFYNPPAFEALARRHRILFGNGSINIPFVPNGELRIDRIYIPTAPEARTSGPFLIPSITEVLTRWSANDLSIEPITIPTVLWTNGELWRYL